MGELTDKQRFIKGYSEGGLAKVLGSAGDLLERAAICVRNMGDLGTPSVSRDSYRKEASICIAEAEELIAAVRNEGRL